MLKYLLIYLLVFPLFVFVANAQNYRTSVGVKLLWDNGMSQGVGIKRFIPAFKSDKNNDAIELIINRLWKGGLFSILWERENPVYITNVFHGLYWYWGAGSHLGDFMVQEGYCRSLTGINRVRESNRVTKFGVDGILGLEFELDELDRHHWVPIQVSVDFKPYYDIYSSGCGGNWVLAAALTWGLRK